MTTSDQHEAARQLRMLFNVGPEEARHGAELWLRVTQGLPQGQRRDAFETALLDEYTRNRWTWARDLLDAITRGGAR